MKTQLSSMLQRLAKPLCFLILLASIFVTLIGGHQNLQLSFEMKADEPTTVQIADANWNHQQTGYYSKSHDWQRIVFENVRNPKEMIFKLSFVPDNKVIVRNILFISPSKVESISLNNVSIQSIDPSVVISRDSDTLSAFSKSGFAQFLVLTGSKSTGTSPLIAIVGSVIKTWEASLYILLFSLLILACLTSVPLRMSSRRFFPLAILNALLILTATYLLHEGQERPVFPKTVGKASYLGSDPSAASQITLYFAFITLAACLLFVYRNRFKTFDDDNLDSITPQNSFMHYLLILFLGICFIFRLGFNQLSTTSQFTNPYSSNWDLENIQTWDAFLRLGMKPNIDFWYPYGIRIFLNPFPALTTSLELLVLGYISFFLKKQLSYRASLRFMSLAVPSIFVISIISITTDIFRVLIPVVGFVWLTSSSSSLFKRSVGTIFFTLLSTAFGSDTLGAWILGATILVLFQIAIDSENRQFGSLWKRIALTPLCFILAFVLMWPFTFTRTILQTFLSSQEHLMASSEPLPFGGSSWQIWLASLVLLFFLAFAIIELGNRNPLVPFAMAVITASFLHLAKSASRFNSWINSADFILLFTVLFILFLIRFPVNAAFIQSTVLVFVVSLGIMNEKYAPLNFNTIAHGLKSEFNRYYLQSSLNDTILANYRVPQALMPLRKERIYVFGDSGMIYVALKQKPYWQISLYNSAPSIESNEVIKRLASNPPKFVVVDTASLNFDLVPAYIRNSDILNFLVRHWVPYEQINDRYWVARQVSERDTRSISLKAWSKLLGTQVDFGELKLDSAKNSTKKCNQDNSFCDYALTGMPEHFSRSRNYEIDGVSFLVRLSVESGDQSFSIPNRFLWFNQLVK
jgi:hypothetical protein